MEQVARTPLYNVHRALGARMTEFAGFEMPVSYAGIIEEHRAVRTAAGLFDVSHMGEFELRGPTAVETLERLMTNSAAALRDHQAQYTLMCLESGGAIDDLIVYRLGADHFMLCVNASNIEADRDWILDHIRDRGSFRDISDETALLALQGPRAAEILKPLTSADVAAMPRFAVTEAEVAGAPSRIARTGYTGEDGFEIFMPADSAVAVFEKLLEAGKEYGVQACGLGARDTLRLEAGLPLYGHELDRETSPIEAGLTRFVKPKREFIGAEPIRQQLASGTKKRLAGILTEDARQIPRQGYPVYFGEHAVGAIVSGTFSPTLNRSIATAYIASDALRSNGSAVQIEIRSRRVTGSVAAMPFYKRGAPEVGRMTTHA